MSILAWIILGGLAGWVASIVTGKNGSMGIFLNIVVGIAGAIVGGMIAGMLGISSAGEFGLSTLIIAILGAILLISLVSAFDREQHA